MSKAAKPFRPVVATGNHLRSGAVIYREADGRWSGEIGRAEIAENPEAAEALLARAKADHDACIVVEPLLIDVDRKAGRGVPRSLRERIRADGPTVPVPGTVEAKTI